MKLLNIFLILIVGVAAHPRKREVDEEIRKVKENFPFMAMIHATSEFMIFQEWAVILTDKWLLTPFYFPPAETFDITVEVYTDLFTRNRYVHEIDSIIELKSKKAHLYPPFKLIKLKSSIIFGDSRKPIPLAGPNYDWKENQEAISYFLLTKFPHELSEPHEYFNKLLVKVMDEKTYESEVSSCLKKQDSNTLIHFECDPAIINGTLVGFHIRHECEKELFLKINSIYDWILNKVPELNDSKYQFSVKENTSTVIKKKFNSMQFLLQRIFESQQSTIPNIMYLNNVSINVNIA